MKYNEKVERYAPKLGRKNLLNGLSCPPFVYMEDSDEGMWVHYVKYCENIAHHKYKRCLAVASKCRLRARWFGDNAFYKKEQWALQWHRRWLELAEKFKPNKEAK